MLGPDWIEEALWGLAIVLVVVTVTLCIVGV